MLKSQTVLFRNTISALPVLFRADEDRFAIADQRGNVVANGAREEVDVANIADVDPIHADLEAVGLGRAAARFSGELAEEDEVDLVAVLIASALVDALVDAGKALGNDCVAGFLQKLAPDGLVEHFAGALSAAGKRVVFTEAGAAAVYQNLSFMKYDGLG